MKIFTASSLLLFFFIFCNAQNQGKIISNEKKPKAGIANLYFYLPPKNLLLPGKIEALAVYKNKNQFYVNNIPVYKVGKKYQFIFKAPDSISVLIMGIVDAKIDHTNYNILMVPKKKVIDNNNDTGFIFDLYDKDYKKFYDQKITLAGLLLNDASYWLDLKKMSNKLGIKMYEDTYKLHPEFKMDDSYMDYLIILYGEKKDTVKEKLLAYIDQMKSIHDKETKWLKALRIYRLLKMDKEQYVLENEILSTFPNGQLAKQKFWNVFYTVNTERVDTEQSILATMNDYISRFNDSSNNVKDIFYCKIVSLFFSKKEWTALSKYEELISNKLAIANRYDDIGWKLSGGQLNNQGSDLQIAKLLSRKSLDYVEKSIKNSTLDNQQEKDLQNAYYSKYINTYALILYKLDQFDSAFYYQDIIYQQNTLLDVDGLERYAVYAEKIKGTEYAKRIIEQNLLSGIKSPIMQTQLQSIYKQLRLPVDRFKKLQEMSNFLIKQKNSETIIEKLGTTAAKEIVLKNLIGQEISLSSFINKVVVLDFWATWCGPCKASFPAMQDAINKYKEDNEVAFLFIDVWERKEPKKNREEVAKFIKDNNYNFNVLFDINDKVVNDYKINSIPTKFVIDKKGNIVYMGNSSDIVLEIENAKN